MGATGKHGAVVFTTELAALQLASQEVIGSTFHGSHPLLVQLAVFREFALELFRLEQLPVLGAHHFGPCACH